MGNHDKGYKLMFSYPAMVKDLIIGFVREDWVNNLDFDTLERRNNSYVSDDLREREDDLIWRVKWKDQNRWMYIYLLIEFQTTVDGFMGVRLMNYVSLLYQDIIRNESLGRGDKLPSVLPMVVYRGDEPWNVPLDVGELIEPAPGSLSRYSPSLRYLLLEERSVDDDLLESMTNLVAGIIRVEKSESLKDAIRVLHTLLSWASESGDQQDSLRRAIKAWFRKAQEPVKIVDEEMLDNLSPEEVEPMLFEKMEKWSLELIEKGQEEGREEGKTIGASEILENQLVLKFGPLDDATIGKIRSADKETLRHFSEHILTATCLEQVFEK